METEKFLDILRTILQRSETDIENCEDFIEEDLPVAIDGIRYVSEYAENHKDEVSELLKEKT